MLDTAKFSWKVAPGKTSEEADSDETKDKGATDEIIDHSEDEQEASA